MSVINKGKKLSNKTKLLISLSGKGKIISKECREKLSLVHRGKKLSKEHKKKLSYAHSKIVLQTDLNNNIIKEWDSAKTVFVELGYFNIPARCRENKEAYGFKWRYK